MASIDAVLDYLDGQRDMITLGRMSDLELKDIGITRAAIAGVLDARPHR